MVSKCMQAHAGEEAEEEEREICAVAMLNISLDVSEFGHVGHTRVHPCHK